MERQQTTFRKKKGSIGAGRMDPMESEAL